MITVYILHSLSVNKYCTGFTSLSAEERLAYHNAKNSSFTNQANDWVVIYSSIFETKKEAMGLEKKIKKRGAARFLDS